MADAAIRVQRVFKKFRRGEQFDSLRDVVAERVLRRRRAGRIRRTEFWALHDVSFDVAPGESFGIIGPNGAGKSTMLKLLAGIMRPDRGVAHIRGPVSPLIELGAGFHGDLTGRENIYLNASILGLPRRRVRCKFDEIVEFAGIGDFLDTPVKRYSSGMYARLGFSIAAHADPRVLLVDEVLSVGDRVFRARCMERMRQFLRQGVAVMFVSHDLGAVNKFCDRTMVLTRGRTVYCGATADAVRYYYDACADPVLTKSRKGRPPVTVSDVHLCDADGARVTSVLPGALVRFHFDVTFDIDIPSPSYGLSLVRLADHLALFETSSTRLGVEAASAHRGDRQQVSYTFSMNVPPGEYAVGLHVRDRDGLTYAIADSYATQIMVGGRNACGGIVYLDPRVAVDAKPSNGRPRADSVEAGSVTLGR